MGNIAALAGERAGGDGGGFEAGILLEIIRERAGAPEQEDREKQSHTHPLTNHS
jgi:hypothetical protein